MHHPGFVLSKAMAWPEVLDSVSYKSGFIMQAGETPGNM